MTKFSFEVPIKHLWDFEDLQDFHFSLSFLYENEYYKKFMIAQSHRGLKPVWLDNSYNEKLKADNHHELITLAQEIDCAKVIAPDDPNWEASMIFNSYEAVATFVKAHRIIVVVKDKAMLDKGMKEHPEIFTYAYSYWNRLKVGTLGELQWSKQCHFLGMCSVDELESLKPPSCDTSMPIKLALKDQSLEAWEREGCPHIYTHEMPDFFTMSMTPAQVELARRNIINLKRELTEE